MRLRDHPPAPVLDEKTRNFTFRYHDAGTPGAYLRYKDGALGTAERIDAHCIFSECEMMSFRDALPRLDNEGGWQRHHADQRLNGKAFVVTDRDGQFLEPYGASVQCYDVPCLETFLSEDDADAIIALGRWKELYSELLIRVEPKVRDGDGIRDAEHGEEADLWVTCVTVSNPYMREPDDIVVGDKGFDNIDDAIKHIDKHLLPAFPGARLALQKVDLAPAIGCPA
jgi:hypothetical protein